MGQKLRWKIFRCNPHATMPTNMPGNAGFDLYFPGLLPIVVSRGQGYTFPLGLKCSFPDNYVALLWDRSGLGIKGMHRTAGVIDSNYRGEWAVHLINLGKFDYKINPGDRIAQVIFQKLPTVDYGEVFLESALGLTQRGADGFGSTGK